MMVFEFEKFGKIPRLSRDIVVTEKIDGTNAQVSIWTKEEYEMFQAYSFFTYDDYVIAAGSRNRWISPGKDNFGFATWVGENRESLVGLGPGRHYGEWWGKGIQRGYGLDEKKFSLFNTHRWSDWRPECCHVVPVLYQGPFDMGEIESCLRQLELGGSFAAPGFMNPEGVVIYHTAGNVLFKKTIHNDELPKGVVRGAKENDDVLA